MSIHREFDPCGPFPGHVTVAVPMGGEDGQALVLDRHSPCLLKWGEPVKGEKGDKGDKGDRGEQGPQGPAGRDGADGKMGPRGRAGEPGARGEKGETGPMGPAGLKGRDGMPGLRGPRGADGRDGRDGKDGRMGPQGQRGERGPQGPAGPINIVDGLKLHAAMDMMQDRLSALQRTLDTMQQDTATECAVKELQDKITKLEEEMANIQTASGDFIDTSAVDGGELPDG